MGSACVLSPDQPQQCMPPCRGYLTGLTRLTRDPGGKRLELLKEVVPGISPLEFLWMRT